MKKGRSGEGEKGRGKREGISWRKDGELRDDVIPFYFRRIPLLMEDAPHQIGIAFRRVDYTRIVSNTQERQLLIQVWHLNNLLLKKKEDSNQRERESKYMRVEEKREKRQK